MLIVGVAAFLTACARENSSPVCPTLPEYTAQLQQQAAAELGAMPESAALVRFMGDYAAMRAEVRACRG